MHCKAYVKPSTSIITPSMSAMLLSTMLQQLLLPVLLLLPLLLSVAA
jgi:hypothetical protein